MKGLGLFSMFFFLFVFVRLLDHGAGKIIKKKKLGR